MIFASRLDLQADNKNLNLNDGHVTRRKDSGRKKSWYVSMMTGTFDLLPVRFEGTKYVSIISASRHDLQADNKNLNLNNSKLT
jgi:hypothetical protein